MTEAEVRARIIMFADASSEPVLSSADLDILVSMARRKDEFGLAPTDSGYTATWDISYAIAQGWLAKAGRTANRYLFMTGGKMLSRQQYHDHCIKMARRFANRTVRVVPLRPVTDLDAVPNNWNW